MCRPLVTFFFLSMCFIVNSCIILILVSGFLPCFLSIVVIVFSFLYFVSSVLGLSLV